MAQLTYLVTHCSYTGPGLLLTPDHIRKWHREDNGWSRVGYTDLLTRDGVLHNLVNFNQDDEVDYNEMTWGVKGINGIARHICLEGGKGPDGEDLSPLVMHPAMYGPLMTYYKYTILRHPLIKIAGHYQFDDNKPFCPGTNIPKLCRDMGIDQKNIFEH